jgi:hypothetical protein
VRGGRRAWPRNLTYSPTSGEDTNRKNRAEQYWAGLEFLCLVAQYQYQGQVITGSTLPHKSQNSKLALRLPVSGHLDPGEEPGRKGGVIRQDAFVGQLAA